MTAFLWRRKKFGVMGRFFRAFPGGVMDLAGRVALPFKNLPLNAAPDASPPVQDEILFITRFLFLANGAEESCPPGHCFPDDRRFACQAWLTMPGIYLELQLKVTYPAAFIDKVADGCAAAFNSLPQNMAAAIDDSGPFGKG